VAPAAPAVAEPTALSLSGKWKIEYQNPSGSTGHGVIQIEQRDDYLRGWGKDTNGNFQIKGSIDDDVANFGKIYVKNGKALNRPIDYSGRISQTLKKGAKSATILMSGVWRYTKDDNSGMSGHFEAQLVEPMRAQPPVDVAVPVRPVAMQPPVAVAPAEPPGMPPQNEVPPQMAPNGQMPVESVGQVQTGQMPPNPQANSVPQQGLSQNDAQPQNTQFDPQGAGGTPLPGRMSQSNSDSSQGSSSDVGAQSNSVSQSENLNKQLEGIEKFVSQLFFAFLGIAFLLGGVVFLLMGPPRLIELLDGKKHEGLEKFKDGLKGIGRKNADSHDDDDKRVRKDDDKRVRKNDDEDYDNDEDDDRDDGSVARRKNSKNKTQRRSTAEDDDTRERKVSDGLADLPRPRKRKKLDDDESIRRAKKQDAQAGGTKSRLRESEDEEARRPKKARDVESDDDADDDDDDESPAPRSKRDGAGKKSKKERNRDDDGD